MQFKNFAAVSAAALALGLSASASASVINFDQAGAASPTGSISYDGNGGALIGSGISFDEVSLNGGTVPDGHASTLTCVSCSIDFATGDNISEGLDDNVWSFAGGGYFKLSGTVMNGNETIADGTLFSGVFDGGGSQFVFGTSNDSFTAALSGEDDFNSDLASYFGLSGNSGFAFSNTEIALGNATFGDNGSFDSGLLRNADVTVEASSQDVPEPSPLAMFAIGLALVAGGLGFRRKQNGGTA
ncbi:PEP-CTERM sorting domain-containing protein [Salinisphaera sp.]|uniref:PEP-CTERM sorting domain-containing protein n=1 Tax=Salinisphaera sp. TaxID=1914330 RepID=UPI002D76C6C9|nr:PEP-CTERM sorting domain-containing protein [Salinisphaera sp.]HET7314506.1 PEP-CTERM sorting domain-containing protein [Salinisphaera sp.]